MLRTDEGRSNERNRKIILSLANDGARFVQLIVAFFSVRLALNYLGARDTGS